MPTQGCGTGGTGSGERPLRSGASGLSWYRRQGLGLLKGVEKNHNSSALNKAGSLMGTQLP